MRVRVTGQSHMALQLVFGRTRSALCLASKALLLARRKLLLGV